MCRNSNAAAKGLALPQHALCTPITIIGYGNVGRGVLPLLERHFSFAAHQLHVIEPLASTQCGQLPARGYTNIHGFGLTKENFKQTLDGIYASSKGGDAADTSIRGFLVNCSVDTCSVDLAKYAQSQNLIYVDTVVEPWKGYYWDKSMTTADRSNYALRERMLELKRGAGGTGSTCVSCAGANPGMVQWILKDALLQLARDTVGAVETPRSRSGWAQLMRNLGVKGVHIAERDTQFPKQLRPLDAFWNTWSVEGFLSEGFQPAELGWGTHELWLPANAKRHSTGCKAAIYLEQPGAATRVRTWCPSIGPQFGYLVTHNEAISTADYYTIGSGENPEFRPTAHYAYHPCDAAIMSFHECFGRGNLLPKNMKVMMEDDIGGGFDELGVLLYGHQRNAMWMGSTLTHEQCRALVPEQSATTLQVTSAMIAALTWAIKHPQRGICEAEDMDHDECLDVQKPYLGRYWHAYTDWTPLDALLPRDGNQSLFAPPARTNVSDPWQFANVLV